MMMMMTTAKAGLFLGILTFNVAMEFAFRVEVLQALEHFAEDDGDLHFVEMAGLHQVERRTAAQVLHNDPQFRLLPKDGQK